jgi:hypothetical protein
VLSEPVWQRARNKRKNGGFRFQNDIAGKQEEVMMYKQSQSGNPNDCQRIHEGMGAEIMQHMETVLKRPDQELLCARYCTKAGAINAFYADKEKNVFMYWYKLRETVKNPETDTAKIVTTNTVKITAIEFLQFLIDSKAPLFVMTKHTERLRLLLKPVMTPELALQMLEAGIYLERKARIPQEK